MVDALEDGGIEAWLLLCVWHQLMVPELKRALKDGLVESSDL